MSQQESKLKPAKIVKKAEQSSGNETIPMVDAQEVRDQLNRSLGNVNFMYGAEDATYDVAGRTLREAQENLKDVLGVPEDATPLVNGEPVSGDYVLQANDDVQFVKHAGDKGLRQII